MLVLFIVFTAATTIILSMLFPVLVHITTESLKDLPRLRMAIEFLILLLVSIAYGHGIGLVLTALIKEV